MEFNVQQQSIKWSEKISGSKFEMEGTFTAGGKTYKVTVCYEGHQGSFKDEIEEIRKIVQESLEGKAEELAKLAGYTLLRPLDGNRLALFQEGKEVINPNLHDVIEKVKPLFEKIYHQELVSSVGEPRSFEKGIELSFVEQKPTDNEPKSYQLSAVCDKVIDVVKGKSPKRAIQIIKQLCTGNDPRFNPNGNLECQGKFKFDNDAVIKELNKRKVDGKDSTNDKIDEIDEKEKKLVAMHLVPLVNREDVSHTFTKEGAVKVEMTQQAGHSVTNEKKISLSEKKSSVSAGIYGQERKVEGLANTAVIKMGDKVVCFRSAKTHKKHLQEERSKTDILMRAEASSSELQSLNIGDSLNGLKKNGDGSYSYQPVIFTMMDSSILKAVGTALPGYFKRITNRSVPIENERKFLRQMKSASKSRFEDPQWKDKGYIEHTVKLEDGKEIKVRELPPIIQNHVFSSASKFPLSRLNARNENISGQIEMLKMVKDKNEYLFDEGFEDLLDKKNIKGISAAIKTAHEKTNDETLKLVLKAFHANLTGKSIDGQYSYNKKDSGGDLAMLTGIQADYLGLSFSPQCKSGHDRTIAAAAHKVAQEVFMQRHEKYFDPEENGADLEEYKKIYSEAIIKFGFSNVEASRGPVTDDGKSGLKIKGSLAANKYMNKTVVEKHGRVM